MNIINQTQRPQVMHKVILNATRKHLPTLTTGTIQLITLATVILNKNHWVTVPSLSWPLTMNPGIYQRITPILLATQMLLAPATKEVVVNTASVSMCIHRTPWQLIKTGIVGSTPGNVFNSFSVIEPPSPVMILIVSPSSPCGLSTSHHVANK